MIVAPINEIQDDYRRVKRNYKAKLSNKTLEYLHYRDLITVAQMNLYKAKPKDKTIVTYTNVVIDINQKFLEFFETV